jgi:5-methylthioadenosine/S-adenosylhomocysteine deaminase
MFVRNWLYAQTVPTAYGSGQTWQSSPARSAVMVDLLISGGTVATQDVDRTVITDGAVAIEGDEIVAVGPTSELESTHDPDSTLDATGRLVLPGLINTHTHVSDLLLRGGFDPDRGLYDWLYNVKRAGIGAMEPEDHATAARLYSYESLAAGVTTFVENDGELTWDDEGRAATDAKLDVYDRAGLRCIYGRGMMDAEPGEELYSLVEKVQARNPETVHQPPGTFAADTDTVLSTVEDLLEEHHGRANGRISVWPAPVIVEAVTTECLQGAYDLAEEYDVMTTVHVAEAEYQGGGPISSIEYLRNIGCLGDRALLAHCVYIDQRDARILAETDTKVAHNLMSNLRLGGGFAPVRMLRDKGVTTAIGTDNAILSDTINPLSDLRVVASAHSGHTKDPGVLSPQEALDMATVEAAAAIRRPELGTLEPNTKADVVLLDTAVPQLTPMPDPVRAVVFGSLGSEVETVVCDGNVVVEDGTVRTLGEFDDIQRDASETAAAIRDRAGIQ